VVIDLNIDEQLVSLRNTEKVPFLFKAFERKAFTPSGDRVMPKERAVRQCCAGILKETWILDVFRKFIRRIQALKHKIQLSQ
jgi:hypothetical protein